MSRPRLTIAQWMAIVLYVGLGFAALRNADVFWASATFTAAIISVSTAVVGAIAHEGKARMTWTGFAVFGWACIITGLLPARTVTTPFGGQTYVMPDLLTEWLFYRFHPALLPGNEVYQVAQSLGVIFFGLVGAIVGRLLAAKDGRPSPWLSRLDCLLESSPTTKGIAVKMPRFRLAWLMVAVAIAALLSVVVIQQVQIARQGMEIQRMRQQNDSYLIQQDKLQEIIRTQRDMLERNR
jgi:low affinity Fe/Cu permease